MPMNKTQIRAVIEQQLALYPGTLFGATLNAARNANGDRAHDALIQAARDDIETAAQVEEDGHAPAR